MKAHLLALLFYFFAISAAALPLANIKWVEGRHQSIHYWMYIPDTGEPQASLMLNLHGCTQHAVDLKELGN